jgi:diguanylate cyclase (GGDEF)-like protein
MDSAVDQRDAIAAFLELLVPIVGALDTLHDEPRVLIEQSGQCRANGDHERGAQLARAAAAASVPIGGDDQVEAMELLAAHLLAAGDLEHAAFAAHGALSMARALGNNDRVAGSLRLLAETYCDLGMFGEAFVFAGDAVASARSAGNEIIESEALISLSRYYRELGEFDETRRLLDRSLHLARSHNAVGQICGALIHLADTLGALADIARRDGDSVLAEQHLTAMVPMLDEGLELAMHSGLRANEAYLVSNLADISIVRGDHIQARDVIDRYVAIARQYGFRRLVAYGALDDARLLTARGCHGEVIERLNDREHQLMIAGSPDLALLTQEAIYRAYYALGDFAAAFTQLEAHARAERERFKDLSQRQAHVLLARMDVEQAQAEAEHARLDAQVQSMRAAALEQERDVLARQAFEDSLTGLANRRAADDALTVALATSLSDVGSSGHILVAVVDLDHFKAVNDTFGHAMGDRVLVETGHLLQRLTRPRDRVFRYGGEEFLIVLDSADPLRALEACERIRLGIEQFDWANTLGCTQITASFGVAARSDGDTRDTLMARADDALYRAKVAGRNQVVVG